jgi:hypothetical protein
MTRDEVIARLKESRAVFDERLAAVPHEALALPVPGSTHSAKDIVAHVTAYDDLIVQRLVESRHGRTTAFDRDRDGWESFNGRVWVEAGGLGPDEVIDRARRVFAALLDEVGRLTDAELAAPVGATAALDPTWLEGRAPWEMIGIDAFDHYPMHYEVMRTACRA